jgi:hypothetical protein
MYRACVATVCGITLGSCSAEPSIDQVLEEEIEATPVTVAQLVHDPSSYDGVSVRVRGHVNAVLGARVLLLRDYGLLWAPKIVVITDGTPITERDDLHVAGVAYARLTAEVARELEVPLATALRLTQGATPVVIARWVRRSRDR